MYSNRNNSYYTKYNDTNGRQVGTTTAQLTGTVEVHIQARPRTITNPTSSTPIVNTAGIFTVLVTEANGYSKPQQQLIHKIQRQTVALVQININMYYNYRTINRNRGGTYAWSGPE